MIEDYFQNKDTIMTVDLWSLYDVDVKTAPREVRDAVAFLCDNHFPSCNLDFYQPFLFSPQCEGNDEVQPTTIPIETVLSILPLTGAHALRARILDVVGFLKKDKALKLQAADEYFENFKELVNREHSHQYVQPLKRGLYLCFQNGRKEALPKYIDELLHQSYCSDVTKLSVIQAIVEFVSRFFASRLKEILPLSEIGLILDKHPDESLAYNIADDLLKAIKDPGEKQEWLIRAIGIAKRVANQESPHGYRYLEQVAKHLDRSSEQYSELKFLIEAEQRKLYDSLNTKLTQIPPNEQTLNGLQAQKECFISYMQAMPNGCMQWILFLKYFTPYNIEELEQRYEENKSAMYNLFNNICFNDDKTIAYESAVASDEDKREYSISDLYNVHLSAIYFMIIQPFLDHVKNDRTMYALWEEIVRHNAFIPQGRHSLVLNKIILGLHKNICEALFYLIPQLEYGFFQYIKCEKRIYPERNGNPINLKHMLVKKGASENLFRDAILEVLDPSLVQHLEYRLCRKLGGNIRNQNYHSGVASTAPYNPIEAEAFFLILLVYCQGFDPDI